MRNAQLRPGLGFEQGFDLYRDEAGDARSIRTHGLDWIDDTVGNAESARPFFLYLHFLDAHWPYPVPEEYANRFADGRDVERFRRSDFKALRDAIHDGAADLSDADRRDLENLYDGALRFLDDQLARFFAGLEDRGLADDTIVCVISDHGEEFGEHGRIGHGHGLWENLLHVPWILRVPGREPERVREPVSLVDLFPTLLASAGIDRPSGRPGGLAGVNRLEVSAASAVLAEHKDSGKYRVAVREGRHKLAREYRPSPRTHDPAAFPAQPGTRWEAELERTGEGRYVATQLKPRDDEPSDPAEYKGHASALTEADPSGRLTFELDGLVVEASLSTEIRHAEGAEEPSLEPGRLVKVEGTWRGETLVADKLKLYPMNETSPFEVRGLVSSLSNGGDTTTLAIGGITFDVDAATRFKGVSQTPQLIGDDVVRILELGLGGAVEAGYSVSSTWFDLERDGGELAGSGEPTDGARGLSDRLDALGRTLLERRSKTAESVVLTPDVIARLQEIGYAE